MSVEKLREGKSMNPITQPLRKVIENLRDSQVEFPKYGHLKGCSCETCFTKTQLAAELESLIPTIERDIEAAQAAALELAANCAAVHILEAVTEVCPNGESTLGKEVADAIRALIGSKQASLDAHDAEFNAKLERATDLVRYARHFLHDEGLISDEEYAAIVLDNDAGKRVARLEGYDKAVADLRRQWEGEK